MSDDPPVSIVVDNVGIATEITTESHFNPELMAMARIHLSGVLRWNFQALCEAWCHLLLFS